MGKFTRGKKRIIFLSQFLSDLLVEEEKNYFKNYSNYRQKNTTYNIPCVSTINNYCKYEQLHVKI